MAVVYSSVKRIWGGGVGRGGENEPANAGASTKFPSMEVVGEVGFYP